MYKYIEPEVSGGLGKETKIDNSSHPPIIYSLHYEFSGWLENDIVESFPCYIVTDKLKQEIINTKLTGVVFDDVKVTVSQEFIEVSTVKTLPKFHWLKIYGKAGRDDFGIAEDLRLVVSDKTLQLFQGFNLSEATFEDY